MGTECPTPGYLNARCRAEGSTCARHALTPTDVCVVECGPDEAVEKLHPASTASSRQALQSRNQARLPHELIGPLSPLAAATELEHGRHDLDECCIVRGGTSQVNS